MQFFNNFIKHILCVVLPILIICDCSSVSRDSRALARTIEKLQMNKENTSAFNLNALVDDCFGLVPSDELSVLYLLNSQCSICYGKLFSFLDMLSSAQIPCPVFVVLRKGDLDSFSFFNEERIRARGIDDDNLSLIPVDSYYPYLDRYHQGDGFVLYRNKVIATIQIGESVEF